MSGPIVRTGTTPEFWKNWDQVFGKGTKAKKAAAPSAKKPASKATAPKASTKNTVKSTTKAVAKKAGKK